MKHEEPISPTRSQLVNGIPSYEFGSLVWRAIQLHYSPLEGDEDSAIESYSKHWGIDSEEVRRIVAAQPLALPSQRTLRKLGYYSREVDGRCTSCGKATTIIHYFQES